MPARPPSETREDPWTTWTTWTHAAHPPVRPNRAPSFPHTAEHKSTPNTFSADPLFAGHQTTISPTHYPRPLTSSRVADTHLTPLPATVTAPSTGRPDQNPRTRPLYARFSRALPESRWVLLWSPVHFTWVGNCHVFRDRVPGADHCVRRASRGW